MTTKISVRSDKNHFSHFYHSGDLITILLQKRISKKKGRQRFQARVISLNDMTCEGKIYVSIEVDTSENRVFYGDTLWTRNSLRGIGPPLNPGAFDFQQYAARKNIFHQLYLKRDDFLLIRGKKEGLIRSSIGFNRYLQAALEKILRQPDELSVAKALLLGERNEIPVDLLDSFKGAGAMHILAISGLHVGIIHMIFLFLTRPLTLLKRGRALRVILIVLGLWSYALLTGMAVSATRSVSMFTLFILGQAINRKISLLHNLINSAFVLLMLKPMLLFDVGFQLSYSALTGIAFGAILMERKRKRKKRFSKIHKYFMGLVVVSCAAQLGVMPLSLYYFKQFSGLFLVSSLLILPALGITLVFGYSVLVGSLIFDLPELVKKVFQAWIDLINTAIEWIGSIEALILKGIYFPFSFWILLSLSLFFASMGSLKRKSRFIYASGICLVCMQLLWIRERVVSIRDEKLIVFHLKRESLVASRKGSVLKLKNSKEFPDQMKKPLKDYSSELPGDFSIQRNREETTGPIQLFYVDKALVCFINEKIDLASQEALGSLARKPDVVILSNAPRINLERLLKHIRPRIAVADGTNHKGFVERCRSTCQALGIEFHATFEKGAFLYPY